MSENKQIFNDRYEIIRKIARGGMADVFLAHDQLLDRPVALKMLFPELSTDRSFVERFRREAQSAANLNHPNIVSVYDWGEEGSTYFIVMEFIDGRPLSQIISAEGSLSTDRAAKIGADVASALGFAHSNGVIHRDVKPGNVMIDSNSRVKVTDFGIARALNSNENLTKTGAVMGTATYFSPEQAQGYGVDPRSDVYSLGVILYEMAAGAPPFSGDNAVAIASKHVTQTPELPSQKKPGVPPEYEAIVMTAMAKEPDNRYASAERLRLDLERFTSGQTVAATAMLVATQAGPATQAIPATAAYGPGTQALETEAIAQRQDDQNHSNRAFVILLLVMLVGLGVLLFLLGRSVGLFGGDKKTPVVQVENIIGKPADEAASIIEKQGLVVKRETGENEAREGIVFDQTPKGGASVKRDSTVKIFVSSGKQSVLVPNVVGKSEDEATSVLEDAGFKVSTTEQESTEDAGKVLSQSPRGTKAEKGSTVRLVISSGVNSVEIPDVSGETASSAANELGQLGLRTTTTEQSSEQFADGEVIRTNPDAGANVEPGSTVTLIVSSGPETTTTSTTTTTTDSPSGD